MMMRAEQMLMHIDLCAACSSRKTFHLAKDVTRHMLSRRSITQRELNIVRKYISHSHA
jgi:hypothetical protein